MGKTSRRRPAAKDQSIQVTQEPAGAEVPSRPRTGARKSFWSLNKWEKLGLLSGVTVMTVRCMGPYVPGTSVIMETELVKIVSGAIAGVSVAGILIS